MIYSSRSVYLLCPVPRHVPLFTREIKWIANAFGVFTCETCSLVAAVYCYLVPCMKPTSIILNLNCFAPSVSPLSFVVLVSPSLTIALFPRCYQSKRKPVGVVRQHCRSQVLHISCWCVFRPPLAYMEAPIQQHLRRSVAII